MIESSNHLTLDGADWRNAVTGGSLSQPALAALQETRITTAGAQADNGASVAASLQLFSKAGSNQWHGSAGWLTRGKPLQALPATFDRGLDVPAFKRQQWMGTLGGPLIRDHVFAFGSFEYRQQDVWQQVSLRDEAARTIKQGLTSLPGTTALGLARLDWNAGDRDRASLLYAAERSEGNSLPVLQRTFGTASQRQRFDERFDQGWLSHARTISPVLVNEAKFGFNGFRNTSRATSEAMQRNFPSLQDGAPFRVPALPRHQRWQFSEGLEWVSGTHTWRFGGEWQRLSAEYVPGFSRAGAVEFAEDFARVDRNADGRINDQDLLVSVTLHDVGVAQGRSANVSDTRWLAFAQDDWRVRRNLTLNLGLRWQLAANEKNLTGLTQINPLARPFLRGERKRDANNFAPRVGLVWASDDQHLVFRGSHGWFYDAIPLHYAALERALDGRHTVIAAQDMNGQSIAWPNAPGLHLLDNALQNPMLQTSNLELERWLFGDRLSLRVGFTHSFGTHFLLARSIGSVRNPIHNASQSVIQLESSAKTKYDALQIAVERHWRGRWEIKGSYTLSKAFNYTNGDQLPFFTGLADANNLRLEYGPSPIDQRHRFNFVADAQLWRDWHVAALWTVSSGVPMDILLPDASARLPYLQRNAGGRLFRTGADLNRFIAPLNLSLPRVRDEARFNDGLNNFDLRVTKRFKLGGERKLELGADIFNLFNVTNVFGLSNVNYSGFANVLARDIDNPNQASSFGRPVTTAGGWFTAGGPRGVQGVMKISF